MKKIIKHGKIPNFIKYYFVCVHCGCEFTMTNEDLMEEQQSIVFVSTSKCPECGRSARGIKED